MYIYIYIYTNNAIYHIMGARGRPCSSEAGSPILDAPKIPVSVMI